MDACHIVIDSISGGKIEETENNFVDVENRPPQFFHHSPLQFAKSQGGKDTDIKFNISLHACDEELLDQYRKRSQIVAYLRMEKTDGCFVVKPHRFSNWQFTADGTATFRLKLTYLTKEYGLNWISFGMVDRETTEPLSAVNWSQAFPVNVVSKYPDVYLKNKEKKAERKRKMEETSEWVESIDCGTDTESQCSEMSRCSTHPSSRSSRKRRQITTKNFQAKSKEEQSKKMSDTSAWDDLGEMEKSCIFENALFVGLLCEFLKKESGF